MRCSWPPSGARDALALDCLNATPVNVEFGLFMVARRLLLLIQVAAHEVRVCPSRDCRGQQTPNLAYSRHSHVGQASILSFFSAMSSVVSNLSLLATRISTPMVLSLAWKTLAGVLDFDPTPTCAPWRRQQLGSTSPTSTLARTAKPYATGRRRASAPTWPHTRRAYARWPQPQQI